MPLHIDNRAFQLSGKKGWSKAKGGKAVNPLSGRDKYRPEGGFEDNHRHLFILQATSWLLVLAIGVVCSAIAVALAKLASTEVLEGLEREARKQHAGGRKQDARAWRVEHVLAAYVSGHLG